MKKQASGWPTGLVTEEQKEQYLSDYASKTGVTLDRDQIKTNQDLHMLAKHWLKTFWKNVSEG